MSTLLSGVRVFCYPHSFACIPKIRAVHGLGQVNFRPNSDSTLRRRVEGRSNPKSTTGKIGRFGFLRWLVSVEPGQFSKLKKALKSGKKKSVAGIQNFPLKLENIAGNKIFFLFFFLKSAFFWLEIAGIQPNLAKSLQIQPDLVEISLDLACFVGFGWIFLQLRLGSGCSGFGDATLPLDLLVSVFENGNPPPTDQTFSSGRNRVVDGLFGRVVGLQSGLDSPTQDN